MPMISSWATRRFAVVIALSLGSSTTLIAQGTIRGRVIDAATQRPLSDARVTITGSEAGAVTNAEGDYVIANAPAGQKEVTARRLGFGRRGQTVNVPAGGEVTANFALPVSATQLEEIVVTGTGGSVERRTIGNSITTLDVAELTSKSSVLNVTEILQSKTPGVTILPGSGAPGTAGEIRIRGASSTSGYKPVVFIDGIRFNIDDLGGFSATGGGTAGLAQSTQVTSALNNLNPNDIESIEVIKGPAAATLYGAEAANGVIQIITKKGTKGQQKMNWGFRAERGTNTYHLIPEDNYTTCDAAKRAAVVSATDTTHVWPGCLAPGVEVNSVIRGNPMRDDARALRTGDLSRLGMTFRGGGDKYQYFVSGDRENEQGVFYNSDNDRTSVRSNFGFNPTEKSSIQLALNWQDGRLRLPIQDESANGLLLSARRGEPGRISRLGVGNEGWRTISPDAANRYQNYTKTERYTMGGTFHYSPANWFQNRLTLGFDNTVVQAQLLFLPGVIDVSQDADAASGANLRRTPTRKVLTMDYAGTMVWHPNILEMTTSFGSQVVSDKSTLLAATGIGLGAPDATLVNLAQRTTGSENFSENNSVGYYVQEQIGWNDRLYLTGAVRADDHSSFGKNFDIIVFPKFSLSYVASEEPALRGFMEASRISTLKLRSAWGQAGRAPSAFSAPQTYITDRVTLGTNTGSALRTFSYGNPDLKPERAQEFEVGFDMGLFKERIGVDFTFYNKTTKDMLQSISIPPSTGYISSQFVNLGEVNNRGIEVSLFGSPVQLQNVLWETRLNLSTNKNELLSFGIAGRTVDTPSGQAYGSVQQHRVGFPLGGYWVTPPQRAADGSAILTPGGAAIFNPGDTARRYVGPSSPTHEIGFSNTLTLFKRVRLYGLLDAKGGHFIFNLQERNRCQSNDNCWRTNNPNARFPKTAADTILFKELAVYRNTSVSPEWIQKADFVKLRELSLTLDLPPGFAGLAAGRTASFTLSGRNLKVWSDYEGVDPEVNSYGGRNFVRVDAYAAPMMRRWSASFNIQY